ncbi:MAG: recombination mediator RecR [Myxococcota bacterium]
MLPGKVQQLVSLLARLPGVGEKTAQRFAVFLATRDRDGAERLGRALLEMAAAIGRCHRCGNLAETVGDAPPRCDVCTDTRRDATTLCVVARIQDLMSIERSAAYRGYYFVLGRLLSPLEGIGADELPLEALRHRILDEDEDDRRVREVLVATPPSVDGEATALLLAQELRDLDVTVTRIASGVPHGGDLEYADPVTIGRAIAGRRDL